jgi:hypothetical protein
MTEEQLFTIEAAKACIMVAPNDELRLHSINHLVELVKKYTTN